MHESNPICVSSVSEERLVLNRMLLISAIAAIALAHGVVFYKIDKGVHAAMANQVTASRSHRAAYW
jgi:hypothetical protein